MTGRTLGIVGHGTLGRGVAHAASAFGMNVLIANRPGGERQAGRVDLDELLPRVDVPLLALSAHAGDTGMIDATRLMLMKPDAVLITPRAAGSWIQRRWPIRSAHDVSAGQRSMGAAREPPVDGDPLLAADIPNSDRDAAHGLGSARRAPALPG